jgi:hypothetical protein
MERAEAARALGFVAWKLLVPKLTGAKALTEKAKEATQTDRKDLMVIFFLSLAERRWESRRSEDDDYSVPVRLR